MAAEHDHDQTYLQSGSFAFFKGLAALSLALYASYYVSETAGVLPRLLLTVCFCLCVLGLNRWWDRMPPDRRCRVYTLSFGLVCLGSLRLFLPVSKSLIWLLLYLALCLLLREALRKRAPRRVTSAATLLGLLFAAFTWMGYQLKTYDQLALLRFSEYTKDHAFEWIWFTGFALLLTVMGDTAHTGPGRRDPAVLAAVLHRVLSGLRIHGFQLGTDAAAWLDAAE